MGATLLDLDALKTKSLKICLVNADFLPFRGSGQAVYAEKLAKGLSKKHQVTVVTRLRKGARPVEQIDDIRVIRIPSFLPDPSQWILFGWQVARFLHRRQVASGYDIVHFLDAHVGYAYKGRFLATLHQSFEQRLKGDRGLPYSSSTMNLIKRYPYYQFSRVLEKAAVRKCSAFISVSDAIRNEFVTNYNVDPSRIVRIYNGIDNQRFRPVDVACLKRRYNIEDEKILLYVGFSTPRKGVETLVQALSYVREKKVKLIIVGKWEAGYRQKVLGHLDGLSHTIIEAGYVPDDEMPAFYSLADIFVLPSLLEGFGFPIVESMACATPVIATNVGAIPEVIGRCGIVVPPQSPDQLAERIDTLLTDKRMRAALIRRGMDRVRSHFTLNGMVERTAEFYVASLGRKYFQ